MWTSEEKERLVELYPDHTTKEMCEILGKTDGQIRNMKQNLGLRGKLNVFTEQEKDIIRKYYESHPNEIDLVRLSEMIGRPKTSISRWAQKEGLTRIDRPPTEEALKNIIESAKKYRQTDLYINQIKPKMIERFRYYARHEHPRGMLGKHHSIETRRHLSDVHHRAWSDMNPFERKEKVDKIINNIKKSGYHHTSNENTYSRCRGGYREDLDTYFRSSWEANIARFFNYSDIKWEYERKRFYFEHSEEDNVRSYCPDFYLPELDLWIEVKGWMDKRSKICLEKFEKQFPEYNARLLLINEKAYKFIEKTFSDEIIHWEHKKKALDE